MTRTKVTGMFAFWRYSGFPFALGGTIIEMNEEGRVQTKEYGVGNWFMPFKIVPLATGKALLAKLEKIRSDHAAAEIVFERD